MRSGAGSGECWVTRGSRNDSGPEAGGLISCYGAFEHHVEDISVKITQDEGGGNARDPS